MGVQSRYEVTFDPDINEGDEGIVITEDGCECSIERMLWGAEIARDELDRMMIEYEWASERTW